MSEGVTILLIFLAVQIALLGVAFLGWKTVKNSQKRLENRDEAGPVKLLLKHLIFYGRLYTYILPFFPIIYAFYIFIRPENIVLLFIESLIVTVSVSLGLGFLAYLIYYLTKFFGLFNRRMKKQQSRYTGKRAENFNIAIGFYEGLKAYFEIGSLVIFIIADIAFVYGLILMFIY